jgi:hypothetical protein
MRLFEDDPINREQRIRENAGQNDIRDEGKRDSDGQDRNGREKDSKEDPLPAQLVLP